jgi:hypothetical protein
LVVQASTSGVGVADGEGVGVAVTTGRVSVAAIDGVTAGADGVDGATELDPHARQTQATHARRQAYRRRKFTLQSYG